MAPVEVIQRGSPEHHSASSSSARIFSSISENVTWGQRRRFEQGKVSLPYKQFLGYERGESKDDPPVVNQEQAKLVRRIYTLFMHGKTCGGIARLLTAEGIPTPAGKSTWQASTIESLLTNEKYKGSARLQKKFTVDFLTKKMKVNEGEVEQYYIEESHEAIIAPVEWEAVQDEIKRRKSIGRAYSGTSVLSAKLVCGDCGEWYGRKTWHSSDKYKTAIWQCNKKYGKDKECCGTPHVTEEDVKARFLKVYNGLIGNRDAVMLALDAAKEVYTDTSAVDAELATLLSEIEVVTGLTEKCVSENAASAQNQEEYTRRYNDLVNRYETAKKRYDNLAGEKATKEAKARAIERFLSAIIEQDELLTEFDECLWLTVMDSVVVQRDGTLTFRFVDGTKIEG